MLLVADMPQTKTETKELRHGKHGKSPSPINIFDDGCTCDAYDVSAIIAFYSQRTHTHTYKYTNNR